MLTVKKWMSGFIYHRDNYITVLLASIFRRLTSVGIVQGTIGPPLSIAPLSFGTARLYRAKITEIDPVTKG